VAADGWSRLSDDLWRSLLITLTPPIAVGYLSAIASYEAQVERQRTNPILTMRVSDAPFSAPGAGVFLVDNAPRRLH
jgi:hypothetical protein